MVIDTKRQEYNRRYHETHRKEFQAYQEKTRDRRNALRRERYRVDVEFREKMKAKTNAERKRRDQQRPFYKRALTYGISEDVIEAMMDQGCAICGASVYASPSLKLDVDHDHRTGKVRGVLCHDCNLALACFNDDPLAIEKALHYLLNGGATYE